MTATRTARGSAGAAGPVTGLTCSQRLALLEKQVQILRTTLHSMVEVVEELNNEVERMRSDG